MGGRWNQRDGSETIYLAHPEDACKAELHRLLDNQASGRIVFPRVIHTISVDLSNTLDLTDAAKLNEVGLRVSDIADAQWSKCQDVGEAAATLGFQAVVAPSATNEGIVLAVFKEAVDPNQLVVLDTTDVLQPGDGS